VTLAFHAAPPSGWINDPNALYAHDGRFRMLMQRRTDAPAFVETGWGLAESDDLLRWRWCGEAISAEAAAWAYSGSVVSSGSALEAFHTVHAPDGETQVRRTSHDGGATWSAAATLPVPRTAARRDPFVFAWGGGWRMLLARPCPWEGWEAAAPSVIEVWASPDRADWAQVGEIGSWDPPGVLWEVPVLLPDAAGDAATLIWSRVDRRGGGAACSALWRRGRFDGTGFVADGEAEPFDYGPDFYAPMLNVAEGWPDGERVAVGWIGSWDTARRMPWPGFAGGPISVPRAVGPGLTVGLPERPRAAFAKPVERVPVAGLGTAICDDFVVEAGNLRIASDRDALVVERRGGGFDWHRRWPALPTSANSLDILRDGPVFELFVGGRSVTAAVQGDGWSLTSRGRAVPVDWQVLD
jgi:sucrose-6-phosphate hydrolase SacC (GH32 family)